MYDRKTCLRKRSLDNVLAELSAMKQKFPFIARIIFDDDNFLMYTREEIERFSIDYKAKIGLPLFIGGLSPETVNREKLSFLVNAGLEEVRLGVQSGSVITRKLYNRNHSNDMLWRAVQTFQFFREKLKQINYDIIVDNPWEEEDNIVESLLFIAKIPYPRHLIIYSLTFFPGTELYDRAKQEGIINDDLTDVYRKFYHSVKRTYLNEIFYLLDDKIVKRDKGWMIPLLTCKMFRRIKPIWLIRLLREPGRILRQYLRQGATLLKEGVICLLRGEWGRIWRYMRYSTKK